ncbi:hypothetical protein Scep_019390 [Stephania cephalantha]|uniref:Uncharacterized protein n=1 Tax=Stephania cephalantha TaxID=152367 RepID=A0AAP0IBQ0_9MAGN
MQVLPESISELVPASVPMHTGLCCPEFAETVALAGLCYVVGLHNRDSKISGTTMSNEDQFRVGHYNELACISNSTDVDLERMAKLLRIHRVHVTNCRRDNIVFEETKGNFFSDGDGEFEDDENYVNFDEPPKFDDNDDQGFIEDTFMVFGDEGHVITNIPLSISSKVQAVVDDGTVNQCSVKVVAKT